MARTPAAIPSRPGRSRDDQQARHSFSKALAVLHRAEGHRIARRDRTRAEAGRILVSDMTQAHLTPALRPYLPKDAAVCAAIAEASIAELTGEDYTEAQQEAWIAAVADEERLSERLGAQLTLL